MKPRNSNNKFYRLTFPPDDDKTKNNLKKYLDNHNIRIASESEDCFLIPYYNHRLDKILKEIPIIFPETHYYKRKISYSFRKFLSIR